MPFLDAKALETDPDGMAFLRAVTRPNFEQEEAASPRIRPDLKRAFQVPTRSDGERPTGSAAAETAAALPAA